MHICLNDIKVDENMYRNNRECLRCKEPPGPQTKQMGYNLVYLSYYC